VTLKDAEDSSAIFKNFLASFEIWKLYYGFAIRRRRKITSVRSDSMRQVRLTAMAPTGDVAISVMVADCHSLRFVDISAVAL
jgi:hypothetical protein